MDYEKKILESPAAVSNEITTLYQPLDSHGEEIRLVTLQPGRSNDVIHCNLSKISLKEVPSYQALSYTWGDPNSTLQIYLDGRSHQVTTNLESALYHLRLATESRLLWIDALCINQRDTLERNSQVMHMNGVYQKASDVIIWLGEEAENSNLAFDAFEMLPKTESIHWNPVINPTLYEVLYNPKYALAVQKLFQRSWWHRVWTVQEGILGQRIKFVCGTRQLSGDTLFAVKLCFHKHTLYCCDDLESRPGLSHMAWYEQPMLKLDLLSVSRSFQAPFTIPELLAYYRSRCCADPRDKIYGLLGITKSEEAKLISPDYSSPVSKVYEQTTLKLIEHSRSLSIFGHICSRSLVIDENATAGLPSWVPNWTSEGSHVQFIALSNRLDRNGDYSASGRTSAHIKLVEDGKIALRGILLDSCSRLSEPNNFIDSLDSNVFKGWRNLIADKLSSLYDGNTSTTYYDAYWQTLCASVVLESITIDSVPTHVRTSNDCIHRFWHDCWWAFHQKRDSNLKSEDQMNLGAKKAERKNFQQSISQATVMRRLFISKENELLGLAPMDAEVGDRIALLEGGTVPYILRPKVDRGNEWEIIGDAYVHGIMDGEAWNPDHLIDILLV